jgi:hypothetical protein
MQASLHVTDLLVLVLATRARATRQQEVAVLNKMADLITRISVLSVLPPGNLVTVSQPPVNVKKERPTVTIFLEDELKDDANKALIRNAFSQCNIDVVFHDRDPRYIPEGTRHVMYAFSASASAKAVVDEAYFNRLKTQTKLFRLLAIRKVKAGQTPSKFTHLQRGGVKDQYEAGPIWEIWDREGLLRFSNENYAQTIIEKDTLRLYNRLLKPPTVRS